MSTANPPHQDQMRVSTKYRTYKQATAKLAGWLANTAKSLGVETGSRLGRLGYVLTIAQFTTLTDCIVTANPVVEVPLDIVDTAQTAFTLRQETAILLQGIDLESDKRHQCVIATIDEVFRKLKAHFQASKQASSKEQVVPQTGDELPLNPSFRLLEIEALESGDEADSDAEGNLLEDVSKVKLSKNKKSKNLKKKKKARENAEPVHLLEDEEEDSYFVLMCLLSDLKTMREYIMEIWQEYKEGKLNLVTVSLTTNAAFDVIRTYQDDFPAISTLLSDYSQTIKLILSRDMDESDAGLMLLFGSATEVDHIPIVGECLSKMTNMADLAFAYAFYFLNGPRHLIVERVKGEMEIDDRACDAYGKYRPEQIRSELNGVERLQEDIQLLAAYAKDVYRGDQFRWMTHDHFTMQWRDEFAKTGNKLVTLAQAFGAQVYLDIHHVLRQEAQRGLQDWYKTSMNMIASINSWMQQMPQLMSQHDKAFKMMTDNLSQLYGLLGVSFLDTIMHAVNRRFIEQAARNSEEGDGLKKITKYYPFMAMNPLSCGIILFQALHCLHDNAKGLAFYNNTIKSAGQMYFACHMHRNFWKSAINLDTEAKRFREVSMSIWKTSLEWHDMDYLLDIHGAEAFFDGVTPQNNADVVKHYGTLDEVLDIEWWKGLAPTKRGLIGPVRGLPKVAPNGSSSPVQFAKDLLSYEAIAVTHQLYHSKYMKTDLLVKEGVVNHWTLETLQALLEHHLQEKQTQKKKSKGKGKRKTAQPMVKEQDGSISQVTILETLKEILHRESRALHFDYLSFHVTCWNMLRSQRLANENLFDLVRMCLA
jgi:hypothetical protein